MKHFRNVSTVKCGVSENPAKGLCNLPILNKLQSVAGRKKTSDKKGLRHGETPPYPRGGRGRKKTSDKKGLRPK